VVRIERVIILGLALMQAWWKLHRSKVKRWWKGVKDRLPRHWRPKSAADCPLCQLETRIEKQPEPREGPAPYRAIKSARGRKKQLDTEGWACPNECCNYYGETNASRHAVIGHGKIGQDKTIQRLKCAACETTFSSRKGTPLYYVKTEPEMVADVLWWLAEGVDVSVLARRFGYAEETLGEWLRRAGEHAWRLHVARFRDLKLALIQMDELYAKVKDEEKARWLWLAFDPISKALPALHLGSKRAEDAYALVHELKRRLHPACVPGFTTDGLRAYFHAITAHFGRWFRPPRARKDHWQVDEELRHGQLVKRKERRTVTFTITRMLWGKRSELYELLEAHGFRRLIQTAFIERLNLTIRQGVAALTRRTWSLPQSDTHLLKHVEWWRAYYHWIRPHQTLTERVSGEKPRQRTPAMALGLTDHVWTVGEFLHTPLLTPLARSGNVAVAA
jgi:transposase-like protein/IS1 family transposase